MSDDKTISDVVKEFELTLRRIRKDVRHAEEMHPREAAEGIDSIGRLFSEVFAMALGGNCSGAVKRLKEVFAEEQ